MTVLITIFLLRLVVIIRTYGFQVLCSGSVGVPAGDHGPSEGTGPKFSVCISPMRKNTTRCRPLASAAVTPLNPNCFSLSPKPKTQNSSRIFIDGVLVKSCTTGGPYWMTPSHLDQHPLQGLFF